VVVNNETEEEKLFTGTLRLNARILGLVLGLLLGLLLKGGHTTPDGEYVVGPHLQLLSQFFIGYRVSFLGSIIGFFYGFALGTLCGSMIGWVYNRIVNLRKST
jgi:hypothetical protein